MNLLPWAARAANIVGRGLRSAGVALPDLRPESLMERAVRRTGLDDFGDDSFREPLELILGSFDREVEATFVARLFVWDTLVQRLVNRLQIQATLRGQPEILSQEVPRPLIILGLPRSGTTLLHRLLAEDPAHRVLQTWEMERPVPPPRRETYATDSRIQDVQKVYDRLLVMADGFQSIHEVGARHAEECINLMANDFISIWFMVGLGMPAYRRWYFSTDLEHAYRLHRRQLQLLQWRHRGERWLLKAPVHLHGLEWLLRVYPDACIVQTHRDPLKVVPSLASLFAAMRRPFQQQLSLPDIGQEMLEDLTGFVTRGHAAREAALADPKLSRTVGFLDVDYRDLTRDPLATARRVYDTFGLELSEEAETRMRAFLGQNRQHKHGRHRYTLAQFGLREGEVREQFSDYCQRYDVPMS